MIHCFPWKSHDHHLYRVSWCINCFCWPLKFELEKKKFVVHVVQLCECCSNLPKNGFINEVFKCLQELP